MKDILSQLNKVFENRVRLGIMSLLMVNERVDFNTLKKNLNLSDGNLASHLATLENNQYLEVHKEFVKRKPHTTYSATHKGKKAFEIHLGALESLIKGLDDQHV